MKKLSTTKTCSDEDLDELRATGRSQFDHSRLRAQGDDEIERAALADPDWKDIPGDWHLAAEPVMPMPKRLLSLRIEEDVLAWFRQKGLGYRTRINAVLRTFVMQQKKP